MGILIMKSRKKSFLSSFLPRLLPDITMMLALKKKYLLAIKIVLTP